MGKDMDYSEYSLYRELMEYIWHPDNLEKNENLL